MKILKKSITFQNMEDAREKWAKKKIIICLAIVEKNLITQGMSGKMGGMIVFRQVKGRTIATSMPTHSDKVSEKQAAHRERFQKAVIYGKTEMESPEAKAMYEAGKGKKFPNAYTVAVADFLNAPDIQSVNLSGYTGQVGDKIIVAATDDFKVIWVKVSIFNEDGSLVEEGNAVQKGSTQEWEYTVINVNPSLTGDKIVIHASDMPGNVTNEEAVI